MPKFITIRLWKTTFSSFQFLLQSTLLRKVESGRRFRATIDLWYHSADEKKRKAALFSTVTCHAAISKKKSVCAIGTLCPRKSSFPPALLSLVISSVFKGSPRGAEFRTVSPPLLSFLLSLSLSLLRRRRPASLHCHRCVFKAENVTYVIHSFTPLHQNPPHHTTTLLRLHEHEHGSSNPHHSGIISAVPTTLKVILSRSFSLSFSFSLFLSLSLHASGFKKSPHFLLHLSINSAT